MGEVVRVYNMHDTKHTYPSIAAWPITYTQQYNTLAHFYKHILDRYKTV